MTQTEATALEQNSQLEMRSDNAATHLANAQSERKEVLEMRSDNAATHLLERHSDNAASHLADAQSECKECANARSERKEVPVKAEAPKIPVLNPDEGYAYFEGRIVPMSEAKVSVATHALHYGTACFEGIRGYWNERQQQLYLLKLREHYLRMSDSWNVLRMKPKESIDDLCRITVELVRQHGYRQDVYVRPLTYKASRTIKLTLSSLEDAVTIYTFAMGNYVDISAGLSVCTSSWRRANSNAMPVRAKVTGAYINSSLAVDDATAAGFDEAIMLTHDGTVSEASSCNIFLLRNGKLSTPALSEDILEGITRNALIGMVRDEFGMEVEERRIDRTELYSADEIFMCGTGVQVSPVSSVDRRPVRTGKPGPLTMKLQDLYLSACRGENEKYKDWVTPVY